MIHFSIQDHKILLGLIMVPRFIGLKECVRSAFKAFPSLVSLKLYSELGFGLSASLSTQSLVTYSRLYTL